LVDLTGTKILAKKFLKFIDLQNPNASLKKLIFQSRFLRISSELEAKVLTLGVFSETQFRSSFFFPRKKFSILKISHY